MRNIPLLALLLAGALSFSGCASGAKFSEAKAALPVLASDKGRIFFYRPSYINQAIQPKVRLNGEPVGIAKPRGYFFVDRPPGAYLVETTTEVKRKLNLTLQPGQTLYVKLAVSVGLIVGWVSPELEDAATGERQIATCRYNEDEPSPAPAAGKS